MIVLVVILFIFAAPAIAAAMLSSQISREEECIHAAQAGGLAHKQGHRRLKRGAA